METLKNKQPPLYVISKGQWKAFNPFQFKQSVVNAFWTCM